MNGWAVLPPVTDIDDDATVAGFFVPGITGANVGTVLPTFVVVVELLLLPLPLMVDNNAFSILYIRCCCSTSTDGSATVGGVGITGVVEAGARSEERRVGKECRP